MTHLRLRNHLKGFRLASTDATISSLIPNSILRNDIANGVLVVRLCNSLYPSYVCLIFEPTYLHSLETFPKHEVVHCGCYTSMIN